MDQLVSVLMRELFELALITVALGGDIFAVSVNMGVSGLYSTRQQRKFILLIGLFHLIMPLAGLMIGAYFHYIIGQHSVPFGAFILVIMGLTGFINTLRRWNMRHTLPTMKTIGLAFGVSIDAFTVGLSLGLYFTQIWLAVLLFAVGGMLAAKLGFYIGVRSKNALGKYTELAGALLLVGIGIAMWRLA